VRCAAGTTIIHGGTGSPGFIPVITTVARLSGRRTYALVKGVD
jgi:hypothetical protein